MCRSLLTVFAWLLIFSFSGKAQAQERRREALVDQVKSSIDLGIKYLRQMQRPDGSWETDLPAVGQHGGWTSLAVLALLNAGVPVEDPMINKGLKYLRGVKSGQTYVRALQTMVFVEVGQIEDRERLRDNVNWLIEARVLDGGRLRGWTYGKGQFGVADNSNTQYALLGLWAGRQAGVDIKREIWEGIREFYISTQDQEGGWSYVVRGVGAGGSTLTMTSAGLCGLLIAGMELNAGREKLQADGTAANCGQYQENPPLARALNWISGPQRDRLQLDLPQRTFYSLYGIERVGRLSGLRFLGGHDWYREGCQWLVRNQKFDGSWTARGAWDQWPIVSTSFALLFLSKGRTPVLISKLVHTESWPRKDSDLDWNNDRNDLRHLVDYASKQLFKKLPLAWQNFDMMRAAVPQAGRDNLTDEDLLEVTSDLLQAPILYITGHKSPQLRFREVEKELLKKYVDNGGFIMAEACCGSADFDRGFRALVQQLWPDQQLVDLPGDHPIWRSFFTVPPGQPYQLLGLARACKVVLVYCPQDLSCHWENNNLKEANGELAFKLGANIVAYATGLEPPRARLTSVNLSSGKNDPAVIPRGFLKVAQLKHRGDWQPAPRAMRNLMDHLRQTAGIDVALKTEEMPIFHKNIVDFKFVYMHGRNQFSIPAEEMVNLRFNLQNGGLLFADACCGREAFDASFRKFLTVLFPQHKLEPVPADDDLFSKELNGEKLGEQNIRCRRERGKEMIAMSPFLEGIKINNRWVVLYSKYDIGCALERHQASDCLGYHPDSAFRLAGAAVLYTLRP